MTETSAPLEQSQAEACGPSYDRLMMLEARRRTFEAINRISAEISPGITEEQGVEILKAWLETPFEGGRHARRVDKIEIPDSNP